MRNINFIYFLALAFVISACTKNGSPINDSYISLCAGVQQIQSSTKVEAQPYRNTVASQDNPLVAKILFSETQGVYANAPAGATSLPCHTTIKYTNGSLTYPEPVNNNNVRYPTADNNYTPVYCTGLYPDDNETVKWSFSQDNSVVSRVITGAEDIMFAPEITGKWDVPFTTQNYCHLLAWLKICVSATSSDAVKAWGKIKEISVESSSFVQIPLNLTATEFGSGKIEFSNEQSDIVAYQKEEGISLNTTAKELGSVFCSPQEEYKVTIVTENGTISKDGIKLYNLDGEQIKDVPSIAGKLFVLSLYFTEYSVVEGACTLTAWNDQFEDLYQQNTSNE